MSINQLLRQEDVNLKYKLKKQLLTKLDFRIMPIPILKLYFNMQQLKRRLLCHKSINTFKLNDNKVANALF